MTSEQGDVGKVGLAECTWGAGTAQRLPGRGSREVLMACGLSDGVLPIGKAVTGIVGHERPRFLTYGRMRGWKLSQRSNGDGTFTIGRLA